ncbi:hypothetical protein GJV26_14090 [Massilia dura]|uniref:Uncharacterized protein n=1 Tax=Pseudoduganella dura TaxID=321982 RepID=A0A6I3X9R3_9BURK|nr:hypothetical protein [Pseudoduganella dura]MUI13584.1 hypothetical protein [Pseudoduganella dura]GGX73877.1 hypothetical protein GCM10007386_00930 [Pseudoduganella dura]
MKRAPYFIFYFFVSINAFAETNLCHANEEVIFSCKVKQKTVSLCFSKENHGGSKEINYRYGTDSSRVELVYPEPNEASDFQVYSADSAKTGMAVIGFKKGRYTYSVFHTRSAFGFNGSGVIVKKDQSILQTSICEEKSVDANYLFYNVKTLGRWSENLDYVGPEL